MHSKNLFADQLWSNDDYRHAFDQKQEAHRRWIRDGSRVNCNEFVHYQRRTNVIYAEAGRPFSVRSGGVLMNAQSPHNWCIALKLDVFRSRSDSSLSPLLGIEVWWSGV